MSLLHFFVFFFFFFFFPPPHTRFHLPYVAARTATAGAWDCIDQTMGMVPRPERFKENSFFPFPLCAMHITLK